MNFPKLFKKTSTGADQFWEIQTLKNVIITRWGQIGGAVQTTEDTVKEGKNVGKANETNATEQAEAEAQSQWEKKLKKGYVKSLNDAQEGKVDSIIEGGINPMLAHRFDEQGHKVVYPAYSQPKFDGHRCIAIVKGGKATLWSRTRKPITGLPHIIKELEDLGIDVSFDGELYNHDYRNKFEELTHFIRTPYATPGNEVVQYHIYDTPIENMPFSRRNLCLANVLSVVGPHLVPVETLLVNDEDELMLAFDKFLAQGYEGAMVRNFNGLYVNKRSYDLLKIKEFIDEEFKVIGVEEGRGKLAGHAIFVCAMKNGAEFKAKMKGETSNLKKYWDNPSLAIGKQLTVKFQGYTNKAGVPRFPVALRFKEEV